jgi:SAM-dependent methyltransferase
MKLSNIVRYLNHLDTLSVQSATAASIAEVAKITQTVQESKVQIDETAVELAQIQTDLDVSLQQYEHKLKHLRAGVQKMIEQQESEYLIESTTLYQEGMRFETPDLILTRARSLDMGTAKLLEDRLAAHANWQYPAMVIRPAHSVGLGNLVAFDPLYLVDTHEDLFSSVRSLFTPEYQRRLRYYVIKEYTQDDIFVNLPQKQFGLVYAFYYFDFKPLEIIQQYLDEVFELLRPGGTFLFSFNDCDNWRAVGAAENHFHCYTPGRMIIQHAQQIGYKIGYTHALSWGTTWVELRKPGVLDSMRGGQAVAGVFKKSGPIRPEGVDISVQDLYNDMDLDQLIKFADRANVDLSQAKTKGEFNIKKVRRTLEAHLEIMNYPEQQLRQLLKPKETK